MVEEASDNESEENRFLSGGESFLRPLQLSMAYKSKRKVHEGGIWQLNLRKQTPHKIQFEGGRPFISKEYLDTFQGHLGSCSVTQSNSESLSH